MEEVAHSPHVNKKLMIFGVLFGIILIGGGVLLRGQFISAPEQMDTPQVENQPAAEASYQEINGVKEFTLNAGSFYYDPQVIRVKEGDTVRIVMYSLSMVHDLVIDELGVRSPMVKAGESGVVEFVASRKGTFEFYCSVGTHRSQGQVGTLIIE